jgi:hypothetical protein
MGLATTRVDGPNPKGLGPVRYTDPHAPDPLGRQ